MLKRLPYALLLLPLVAQAQDRCEHSRPFELVPDMSGISTVVFEVGGFDLDVRSSAGDSAHLQGMACASSAEKLAQLQVHQERQDDRLVVSMDRYKDGWDFNLFGENYTRMRLTATLPDDIAVRVDAGSGDAYIEGVANLDLVVGSGEASVRRVAGPVSVVVGSGDGELSDVGPLDVGSVGSGDLDAREVAGDVEIGSIGSGSVDLARIEGSVEVGTIGSGDLDIDTVGGDLRVRSVGSGDIDHRRVSGTLDLPQDD